jgi:hypothetical protein
MKRFALLLVASIAFAATTQTWEMTSYQDFLRGRMSGLSLTRDGKLILGPKIDTIFTSDQPEIWSVARAADGSFYLGTGNGGRLYRIDAAGKSSLIWTASQPEIFAITMDAKGVLYAGTSPDGKIYRIEAGKASEYFDPHARYIWALKFAPDGSLYAATGDQGKIYRITATGQGVGQGSVYYETGQSHVTSLAIDREGRLLAGSEPNGILYRVSAPGTNGPGKAFVLYDANLPEIRAIVPAPDGTIYAAALGGSIARRTNAASGSNTTETITAPTISVTVTDAQAGITPTPKPEPPKATTTVQPQVVTTTTEAAGVERSAIYKINPDNTVETLWSSKEENVYDLALSGNDLVFVTDAQARVYRLGPDRKAALIAQANEGEATRLIETPAGFVVATSHLAKLLRLGATPGSNGPASSGWFESPVHDAGSVARFGRLSARGGSSGVKLTLRAGNSIRPDDTWSEWSTSAPNARYVQWRADVSGAGSFDSVALAYLPQNTPPIVRSINVTSQAPASAKVPAASSSATAAYSITVTDTGETSSPAGTPSQTLGRAPNGQIQINWQADDPDNDKLTYTLYFRGEDETEWKLLKADMTENTYLLDGDVLADGRYLFKVKASDRPSNPAQYAREAELVSAPVLVDNTPPVVTATRNGLDIDVDALDRGSALRRCEYSIDAGPWLPVEAADGVTDSEHERFLIHFASFPSGEHLVVIRVFDTAGNAGLTKVVVR